MVGIVMGDPSIPDVLRARWAELERDPALRDLPYKIELNQDGAVRMSPTNTRHARLQGYLAGEFARQLPAGVVLIECPVLTRIGIRVPDVAWASDAFVSTYGDTSPLPAAPDLCVEVASPSNSRAELSRKVDAYLAAGAREVWIVDENGRTEIHAASGRLRESAFPARVTLPPEAPRP